MYNLQSHIIEHGGATPTWSYMREALSKRFRASCNNAIFHVAKSEICVDMQRGENVTRSNTEEHWWWTHITKKVIHEILKKKRQKWSLWATFLANLLSIWTLSLLVQMQLWNDMLNNEQVKIIYIAHEMVQKKKCISGFCRNKSTMIE